MKTTMRSILAFFALLAAPAPALAQKIEPLKYGNMDQWVTRQVKESRVIGGNTRTLYEVGPDQTIADGKPYTNKGGSPWGTSNVMAKVAGVTKVASAVSPDEHPGHGRCAKLETHVETVKALGIVNMSVMQPGSLFLGSMTEPITSTKGGEKFMVCNTPFTRRPTAVQFDYKFNQSTEKRRKMNGFSRAADVAGPDHAMARLFLQKRVEDADGNITAKRIGTFFVRFDKTTDWVDGAKFEILYGDISGQPGYKASTMGLNSEFYTLNSKGKSVPVQEIGWGDQNEVPTHIILQFTSSDGETFVGAPGNTLWIDNVALVYE